MTENLPQISQHLEVLGVIFTVHYAPRQGLHKDMDHIAPGENTAEK
jgi:hypothetical protein